MPRKYFTLVFISIFLLCMMPVAQANAYKEISQEVTFEERNTDEQIDIVEGNETNYDITWEPFLDESGIEGSISSAFYPPSPAEFEVDESSVNMAVQMTRFDHKDIMEGSSVQWWRAPFNRKADDIEVNLEIYRIDSIKQANIQVEETKNRWHDVELNWVANEDLIWEKEYDASENTSRHKHHSVEWRNISYDFSYFNSNAPVYSGENYLLIWQWDQSTTIEELFFTQSDAGIEDWYNSSAYLNGEMKNWNVNLLADSLHEYGQSSQLAGEKISPGLDEEALAQYELHDSGASITIVEPNEGDSVHSTFDVEVFCDDLNENLDYRIVFMLKDDGGTIIDTNTVSFDHEGTSHTENGMLDSDGNYGHHEVETELQFFNEFEEQWDYVDDDVRGIEVVSVYVEIDEPQHDELISPVFNAKATASGLSEHLTYMMSFRLYKHDELVDSYQTDQFTSEDTETKEATMDSGGSEGDHTLEVELLSEDTDGDFYHVDSDEITVDILEKGISITNPEEGDVVDRIFTVDTTTKDLREGEEYRVIFRLENSEVIDTQIYPFTASSESENISGELDSDWEEGLHTVRVELEYNAPEGWYHLDDDDILIEVDVGDFLSITDWYDLDNVRNNLDMDARLINDLDKTSDGYDELVDIENGWDPIAGPTEPYNATFDGEGNSISDLYINRPTEDWVGVFAYTTEEAMIERVSVNATVDGRDMVGSLAGHNQGHIRNTYSTGNVSGDERVGGLAGENSGYIKDTYTVGSVQGNDYVGGLVGRNSDTVENSYSTADVVGIEDSDYGQLIGENEGTVIDSFGEDKGTPLIGKEWGQEVGRVTLAPEEDMKNYLLYTDHSYKEYSDLNEPWDMEFTDSDESKYPTLYDDNLTWNIEQKTHTLTINIDGKGEEIVHGEGVHTFVPGDEVELIASTDEEGWEFQKWRGDVDVFQTEEYIQFIIEEDMYVEAVFSMTARTSILTPDYMDSFLELEDIYTETHAYNLAGYNYSQTQLKISVREGGDVLSTLTKRWGEGHEDSYIEPITFSEPVDRLDEDMTYDVHSRVEHYDPFAETWYHVSDSESTVEIQIEERERVEVMSFDSSFDEELYYEENLGNKSMKYQFEEVSDGVEVTIWDDDDNVRTETIDHMQKALPIGIFREGGEGVYDIRSHNNLKNDYQLRNAQGDVIAPENYDIRRSEGWFIPEELSEDRTYELEYRPTDSNAFSFTLPFHIPEEDSTLIMDVNMNLYSGEEYVTSHTTTIDSFEGFVFQSEFAVDILEEGESVDNAHIELKVHPASDSFSVWMEDRNDMEEEYEYTHSRIRRKNEPGRMSFSGYVPFHTLQTHDFRLENIVPPDISVDFLLPERQYELRNEEQRTAVEIFIDGIKMAAGYIREGAEWLLNQIRDMGEYLLTETTIGDLVTFLDTTIGDGVRWVGGYLVEAVEFLVDNAEWLIYTFLRFGTMMMSFGIFMGTVWVSAKFANYWYLLSTTNLDRANTYIRNEGRSLLNLVILAAIILWNTIQIIAGPLL